MTNKISDEAASAKINQAGLYGTFGRPERNGDAIVIASLPKDTIKIQNASLSGTTLRHGELPRRSFEAGDLQGNVGVASGMATMRSAFAKGIVGLADVVCDGPEESRSADKSLLPKQPWKLTDMHGARGPAIHFGSDDYAMGVMLFKARFSKCITKIQYARREVNCTIHVTVYEHGSLAFDLTDIQLHQKELTLKPEYIYTM